MNIAIRFLAGLLGVGGAIIMIPFLAATYIVGPIGLLAWLALRNVS